MVGDRLTDTPLSAGTPRPDNSFTSGRRSNSYFTSLRGVRFPGDLGLTTVDLDAMMSFTPGYRVAVHPYALPHAPAGGLLDSPLGRRPARGSGNDFALRAGCRSNLTDYSSMKR
jgi:hypothetical protein